MADQDPALTEELILNKGLMLMAQDSGVRVRIKLWDSGLRA